MVDTGPTKFKPLQSLTCEGFLLSRIHKNIKSIQLMSDNNLSRGYLSMDYPR